MEIPHRFKKLFSIDSYSIVHKNAIAVSIIVVLMAASLVVVDYQMTLIETAKQKSDAQVVSSLSLQKLSREIFQTNSSLMLYLLTADKEHQKLIKLELDSAHQTFDKIIGHTGGANNSNNNDKKSLQGLLDTYIHNVYDLIEVRSDDSKNLTALNYAESNINPLFLEFTASINILIENTNDSGSDKNQLALYKELVKYRYYWLQISSSVRLYIITRSEDIYNNIKQYSKALKDSLSNRSNLYHVDDDFIIEDIRQLENLVNKLTGELTGLETIITSDLWRKDIKMVKDDLVPLFTRLIAESDSATRSASSLTEKTLNDSLIRFKNARDFNFYLLLITLIMSGSLLYMLNRNIRKRFDTIFSAIGNITSGNLHTRVELAGDDEVSKLAYLFNSMMAYLNHLDDQKDLLTKELKDNSFDLEFQKKALDEHAIVSITDASGLITYVNDKFLEISQYQREELIGRYHNVVNSGYHPKEFWEQFWDKLTKGEIWQDQVCNRKKDGSIYWVYTTVIPYLDKNGLPERYISIRNDITDNKLMSDALFSQYIILSAVSDIQSEFIREHDPKKQFFDLLSRICDTADCEFGYILEIDNSSDPLLFLEHARYDNCTNGVNLNRKSVNSDKSHKKIYKQIIDSSPYSIINNLSEQPVNYLESLTRCTIRNITFISLENNNGIYGSLVLANRNLDFDDEIIYKIKPLVTIVENLIDANKNIMRRKNAEKALLSANKNLEKRVQERTIVLETTMTELEKEKQVLNSILLGTEKTYGRDVFVNLVKSVSEALNVSHVMITEIDAVKLHAKTLAYCVNGKIVNDIEYDIKTMPCAKVLDKNTYVYHENLHDAFPDASFIRNEGLLSYIGIPFLDLDNNVIGHIAVFDKMPLQDESWTVSILGVFAAYANNELLRQKSEKDLKENEYRLKHTIQFSNIGTWDLGVDNRDVITSDNMPDILGYSVNNSEITFEEFISSLHPDDKDMVESAISNCINYGDDMDLVHRVIWEDGSTHWLHEKANVINNDKDEPERILGLVQDITLTKNYQDQLEKSYKTKSEFLANMSHELRTPLNAIIGFSKAMIKGIDGPVSDDQKESLELIHGAGKHLLLLISDILDMSKIEAGKMELSRKTTNLKSLVSETVAMVSSLAKEKNIEMIQKWQLEFTDSTIDETRIRQVLFNMLSNAIKFTEKGSVTIICKLFARGSDHIPNDVHFVMADQTNYVLVSIIDTGIGISAEEIHKVFEEFRQVDGSSTKQKGGTGLGMPISKYMVNLHGGEMWAESKVGTGSVFSFIIPV